MQFMCLSAGQTNHQTSLNKNYDISSFSSCHPGAIHPFLQIILVQISLRGKELNKFRPPNRSYDLCLFFCIYPSSMGFRKNRPSKAMMDEKRPEPG